MTLLVFCYWQFNQAVALLFSTWEQLETGPFASSEDDPFETISIVSVLTNSREHNYNNDDDIWRSHTPDTSVNHFLKK